MHRQGWQTATLAMATVVGAPIGGFLAGGPGWRWIFIVNLPISLFALALGARSLPGLHHEGERHSRRFDLLGATFVAAAGASIVVLASSRSLARSPLWAAVLAGVALAAAIGLTRTERRAASPLIPRHLASDPGLARSAVVTFFSGIALFGSFTFVPLILVAPASTQQPRVCYCCQWPSANSPPPARLRRWPTAGPPSPAGADSASA